MRINLAKRIIIIVCLLVIILVGGLGSIALQLSYKTTQEEAINGLKEASTQGANYIDTQIRLDLSVLEQIGNRISENTYNQKLQVLAKEAEELGYLDMAVIDMNGIANYAISGEEADLSDRDYIKKALQGEACISNVLISKVTNSPVVMFAAPLKYGDTVQGALIGRKDGTSLIDITDNMNYGENGFAFIIGKDGTFYAYPERDYVITQRNILKDLEENGIFKDLGAKVNKLGIGNSGNIKYNVEGVHNIVSLVSIPNTDWMLGLGAPRAQIVEGVDNMMGLMLIFSALLLIGGFIFSFLLGKSITKPIIHSVAVLDRISQYDLRTDANNKIDPYTKRKDEIGIMSKAVLTLQVSLRDLVEKIASSAEHIAASSEELSATSQQAVLSANEVARAILDIARGASDQASDTEKGATEIDSLGNIIEDDVKYVADLNEATSVVEVLKDEGFDILQVLVSKTEQTNHNADDIKSMISETNESAKKIETASQMILSIASQTNLLALNAAIEAARAGEAGKGFSVVADEIRKLAEQANKFTEEIIIDIEELTQKSNKAVEVMEEVSSNLKEQTDSVNLTSTKFEGIAKSLEDLERSIEHLNMSSQEMRVKKEEIVGIIENLSAISEENAAGTEEATASIEEQTASMSEIASSSESLSMLAEEMQNSITQFKF